MKKIIITVDANDADYLTNIEEISNEDLEKIKPLLEEIKNFKPYEGRVWREGSPPSTFNNNYPFGEYSPREDMGELTPEELYLEIDEEAFEIFNDLCPYGEYGFHGCYSFSL